MHQKAAFELETQVSNQCLMTVHRLLNIGNRKMLKSPPPPSRRVSHIAQSLQNQEAPFLKDSLLKLNRLLSAGTVCHGGAALHSTTAPLLVWI